VIAGDLQKSKIILPRGQHRIFETRLTNWSASIHIFAVFSFRGVEAIQVMRGKKKIIAVLDFIEQFRKKWV
jgi:hypothetical protein